MSARGTGNHIMKIIAVIAAGVLVPVVGSAGKAQGVVPTTFITVNGNGGARAFEGVGAILGGGGNARYLDEYPAAPSGRRSSTICSSRAMAHRCSC